MKWPDKPIDQIAAAKQVKPFQERSAEAVIEAMFDEVNPQRRFLVADEVGLGKTKVARYVVAETLDRLWDDRRVERIDIVYICSNSQIARQNIRDLWILDGEVESVADRLTLLPKALAKLKGKRVNLVAFTPDTSLRFGQQRGRVDERAMLHHILSQPQVLGASMLTRQGATELFRDRVKPSNYRRYLHSAQDVEIPKEVARAFGRILKQSDLRERVMSATDGRVKTPRDEKHRLISLLRRELAKACVQLLSPDLVILDEFQRFDSILRGEGEDGELASLLFKQSQAKVLLLSATPYNMLTRGGDDDSHFCGFERTVEFLLDDAGDSIKRLRSGLKDMRTGVLTHRDPVKLGEARDEVQKILKRVMVRTERLGATPDRDGMLRAPNFGAIECPLTGPDVTSFVGTDRVATLLGSAPSMVEYWKSAPFLFNFMDQYRVKKDLEGALGTRDDLWSHLRADHMLTQAEISDYAKVDPRNARLRWLLDDLEAHQAFDMLWIPPSLPQTELLGVQGSAAAQKFTKRLIFSGWTVVPKAVAGLTSYEYERRHHRLSQGYESRSTFSGRLVFRQDGGNFSLLASFLPSPTLAKMGDASRVAQEYGLSFPVPMTTMRESVLRRVEQALATLLSEAKHDGPERSRWYALAQFWMDPSLLRHARAAWAGTDTDGSALRGTFDHVAEVLGDPTTWGRPPKDLADVLTDVAIGGPAVAALRSLQRVYPDGGGSESLESAAARIGWGFRSRFNAAEADSLIASESPDFSDYWRQVLRYCVNSGLGSVLDEWMHLVPDQLRLKPSTVDPATKVADAMVRVLQLNASPMRVDDFSGVEMDSYSMRAHFAMRFGQARGSTADGDNPVDIRNAFNSPMQPFVLISTSVGQEGLDFHHYSHAIVHWNLPGSPVDLEQREGRVHRYKGHAVRKNVAKAVGANPAVASSVDPWSTMFQLATDANDSSEGLRPYWIFPDPDGAAIERKVPVLPMSVDVGRLKDLIEATTLYRMTLGQPRQAELLAVLSDLAPDERREVERAMTINLRPGIRSQTTD